MTQVFRSRNRYRGSDLLRDLAIENTGQFKNFCRMSSEDFQNLIDLLSPKIQKRDTNFRECIPVKERLAITLRFLATGDSFISLSYLFKVSRQTISAIVIEVCKALVEVLNDYIQASSFCSLFY